MTEGTATHEPVKAEVISGKQQRQSHTTASRHTTNQIGMMWAFIAVAVFIGAVGGFVAGYVSGQAAHDPIQQMQRYRRNTLYQGQGPTGYGSGGPMYNNSNSSSDSSGSQAGGSI